MKKKAASAPRLRFPRESLKKRRERAELILTELRRLYGAARTELDWETPFELLIAVILSAQATDAGVNRATPALFAAYPDAAALAAAEPEDVMPLINSIGLFRSKARNIVATARLLTAEHGGTIPATRTELMKLPGVGRKTANVVLGVLFNVPAIAVDTHVGRLARRLNFSRHDNPDKVELDLQQTFPEEEWVFAHHALILHGRRVCTARRPDCAACTVRDWCPNRDTFS
ncbi:MAG TPA: endonuclease III [Deinococcales bacterium]|nr:endonuclease III [Deinococcales bacterium]